MLDLLEHFFASHAGTNVYSTCGPVRVDEAWHSSIFISGSGRGLFWTDVSGGEICMRTLDFDVLDAPVGWGTHVAQRTTHFQRASVCRSTTEGSGAHASERPAARGATRDAEAYCRFKRCASSDSRCASASAATSSPNPLRSASSESSQRRSRAARHMASLATHSARSSSADMVESARVWRPATLPTALRRGPYCATPLTGDTVRGRSKEKNER